MPSPIGPPRPASNTGYSRRSTPPRGVCTMPVRTWTDLIPAAEAGAAASSQAADTSARNPSPRPLSSVRISSPRSAP